MKKKRRPITTAQRQAAAAIRKRGKPKRTQDELLETVQAIGNGFVAAMRVLGVMPPAAPPDQPDYEAGARAFRGPSAFRPPVIELKRQEDGSYK